MKNAVLGTALAAALCAFAATNDWENTRVNSINREPARAYSMPLADERAALTGDLEPATPYKMSLNGIWKISWCGDPKLRPLYFWKTDFNDADWFTIDVPSCVEMRGFGSPGYTNVRYPHANKWPQILDRDTNKGDYNPVSSYRRTFTVPAEWKGRDVFLRFDGVYSAYYVWVNGKKVGYAEDSKLPSEFNVTKYLKDGENLLAVEVYRWCDGSYLEDQDMFRYSGIYRDVTLFAAPRTELNDFYVTTSFGKDYKNADLRVAVKARTLDGKGGTAVASAALYDADFTKVIDLPAVKIKVPATGELVDGTLSVNVSNVRLWSAEDPYLYTLVITLADAAGRKDVRASRVGFKEVKIVGNAIVYNGKKIKFKGVNRHECSPENGRSVSMEEMLKDITLFKQFNINTVRTCHYPDHHSWYDLCDRYGIYVVAEANVEAHEPGYGKEGLGLHEEWFASIKERNLNHVTNYRNHPAVTLWSMGNETGHGPGFINTIAAVKQLDPTRPIHWERGNIDADVDSTMYPSVEWLDGRGQLGDNIKSAIDLAEKKQNPDSPTRHSAGKAFFMCEYAHAMGNAIGNFQEYWDVFYKYDSLAGGCIWDWVDQAIWKYTDRVCPKTGKRERFLAYGGDFDEFPNDGPFCCNGVVDPFRNVSAKLVEVGHVHRNLVVEKFDPATGEATLWNRFGFTKASDFDGTWELLKDGKVVASGAFDVPPVEPLARGKFKVNLPALAGAGEFLVNFYFRLRADTLWAKKGYVVARDQLPVKTVAGPAIVPPAGACPVVRENEKTVTVKALGTKAVFCRRSGTLAELSFDGRVVLKDLAPGVVAGPQLTCERAFTDNDRWIRDGNPWKEERGKGFYSSGLTQLRYHARPLKVSFPDGANCAKVVATVEVTGSKSAGFTHESVWTFAADGTFTVKNTVLPYGVMPPALPRLGTTWKLDKTLENMAYYGRGPRENYIDRCTGSFLGWWESTVTDQYEPYVRPQDNGYKCDVRSVRFTDEDGFGVEFSGDVPLFVQALHYGMEDLEFARFRAGEKRHRTPLVKRDEVVLNLDVRQLGLGGASCGPKPMAKYIFPVRKETWTITVKPVAGKKKFLGFF